MNSLNKKSFTTIIIIIIVVIVIVTALIFTTSVNNKLKPIETITISEDTDKTIMNITDTETKIAESYTGPTLLLNSIANFQPDDFELSEQKLRELEREIFLPYLEAFEGEFDYYFEIPESGQVIMSDNTPIYPASLAKLFLMGTIFEAIEHDLIEYDETIQNDLELMIAVSDNAAYNRLFYALQDIDPDINMFYYADVFCENYGFNQTIIHNLFEVDENETFYFATDYILESCAKDVGRLLTLIYKGELVSEKASQAMLDMLLMQERTSKIPCLLPDAAITANKTGELDNYSHDAAIISSPACDYVLVIMTDASNSDFGADILIQELSLEIYEFLNN